MKKTFSIILTLIMIINIFSIFPHNTFASTGDEDELINANWQTVEDLTFNNSTFNSNVVTSKYGFKYNVKDTGSKGKCDSDGLYVDNGYLQLCSSTGNITPITSSINFDLTMDFSVDNSTYDLGTTSKYLIFATGYSSNNYGWIGGDNESENISFKQFINSNMYSDGKELTQIDNKRMSKDNLVVGETYTYEVKYENNNLKVLLWKDNSVLYTFCDLNDFRINTSQINTFLFGDDNGDAFTSGLTYKHLVVKTKDADSVDFKYSVADTDNNNDTFQHANAHDPTATTCIEATYTDGIEKIVRDYPTDYKERYSEDIPTSINRSGNTYSLSTTRTAYYIFGTHFNNSRSYDLMNWKQISSLDNITMFDSKSYNIMNLKNAYSEFDIMCDWAAYDNNGGDCWAGDIIWNYERKCWMYYGSVTFGKMQSTIFFATSDNLTSDFVFGFDKNDHTDCFAFMSGFSKSNKKHPFINNNVDFRFNSGVNSGYVLTYLSELWDNTSNSKYANSIDPCLYYDASGNLWMAYGSWCNGIWTVPINESNGIADFSKMISNTTSYKNNNNTGKTSYDVFSGVKIVNCGSTDDAGAINTGGEGPFIIYDKTNEIYVLTVSYGGIEVDGGYNMRMYTSTSPDGPFYDSSGLIGTNDSSSTTHSYTRTGSKVMDDYTFSCLNYSYSSPGHNSLIYTDTNNDGINEYYNIYHSRYLNNTYSDVDNSQSTGLASEWNDFIHPSFIVPSKKSNKTMVTMPFEYSGETLPTATKSTLSSVSAMMYSAKQVSGYYEYINHGYTTSSTIQSPNTIKIVADKVSDGLISGTISGAVNGTISYGFVNGYNYPIATIIIDDLTYYGTFLLQTDESAQFSGQTETSKKVMTFATMGEDDCELWGVKSSSLPETLNASDSYLSIDPNIFYHSSTSYIYSNGNEISDGSETSEKSSYVYINSKYTILDESVLCYPESNIKLTYDENKSEGEISAYKITGNVGPFFYDETTNTKNSGDISLNIIYYDEYGNKYTEKLYSYIMVQPLEAHMSQYMYNYASVFNPKQRSFCYFTVLNDSTGYNGEGNYTLFNKPEDIDFYANPGYTQNTASGMSYAVDENVLAGSFNYTYSSYGSGTYEHNSSIYPTAEYFIDKSNNVNESGYWDGSKYIIKVALYSQQGNSSAQSNSDERYLSEYGIDETNPSISVYNSSGWDTSNTADVDKFLTTQSINTDFLELQGTKSTTIDEGETFYFKFAQGASPKYIASSYFNVKVNLFDKSTVRDSIEKLTTDENGEKLLASNYTIETWDNYELALRVVECYLNDYKNTDYEGNDTITIVSNGVKYEFSYANDKYYVSIENSTPIEIKNSQDCSSTQDAITKWFENYYNDLFPINIFLEYQNTFNEAMNILKYECNTDFVNNTTTSDKYTQDSINKLLQMILYENTNSFNSFDFDVDSESYWRNIADAIPVGESNRNYVADETDTILGSIAKENYILLTNIIRDNIDGLHLKTNYSSLSNSLNKYTTVVQSGVDFNGIDVSTDVIYDEINDTYSVSKNNTHYTDESWNAFINEYFHSLDFLKSNNEVTLHFDDESGYTFHLNALDPNESMYEFKTATSSVDSSQKIMIDDTNNYSSKQEQIYSVNDKLVNAYNALQIDYYFVVTIPKTLIIDGKNNTADYSIEIYGYLNDNTFLTVKPVDKFNLNSIGKTPVETTVSQQKTDFYFVNNSYDAITTSGALTSNVTAGKWSGIMNFEISLKNK